MRITQGTLTQSATNDLTKVHGSLYQPLHNVGKRILEQDTSNALHSTHLSSKVPCLNLARTE